MNLFRREKKEAASQVAILGELLEKARKAQYQEAYAEALGFLDEASAMKSAESRMDLDITFARADIFMALERYAEAEAILQDLRKDCEFREMKAPLAYTLASLGQLAQKQCHWEKAQEYYEAARELGQNLLTTGAEGRAAAHLADLHLQEGNANYAVYLLEDALPKLDKSGDRELFAYFQGRLALAYFQTGKREQALRALLTGLDMAQRLQHRPQLRFLETLLGKNFAESGNFQEARKHYLAALGYHPQAAERAHLLCEISLCSRKVQDFDSAKQEAEAAILIADELNDAGLIAKAKASLALSHDSDLVSLEDAVQAYENLSPDNTYAELLRRIGTKAALEKLIALKASLPIAAAHAQSDMALLAQKEERFKDALSAWQEAAKLYHEANLLTHEARVQCEIAGLYERLGDGRMALREYAHVLDTMSHLDDKASRGILLANVAAAYSEYGEIESAQDFFKEAIEIAKLTGHQAAEALRRGNYARFLALSNRPKQALPIIQEARKMSESLELKEQAAILQGNEGLVLALLGEYTAAETTFSQALAQVEENRWQGQIYLYWGNIQLEQGQNPSYLGQALELSENGLAIMIEAKLGLANWAIQEERLEDARKLLHEIDAPAKRLLYKRLLALLYQTWSKLLLAEGKRNEAQNAWEEARKLRSIMRMPPINAHWL